MLRCHLTQQLILTTTKCDIMSTVQGPATSLLNVSASPSANLSVAHGGTVTSLAGSLVNSSGSRSTVSGSTMVSVNGCNEDNKLPLTSRSTDPIVLHSSSQTPKLSDSAKTLALSKPPEPLSQNTVQLSKSSDETPHSTVSSSQPPDAPHNTASASKPPVVPATQSASRSTDLVSHVALSPPPATTTVTNPIVPVPCVTSPLSEQPTDPTASITSPSSKPHDLVCRPISQIPASKLPEPTLLVTLPSMKQDLVVTAASSTGSVPVLKPQDTTSAASLPVSQLPDLVAVAQVTLPISEPADKTVHIITHHSLQPASVSTERLYEDSARGSKSVESSIEHRLKCDVSAAGTSNSSLSNVSNCTAVIVSSCSIVDNANTTTVSPVTCFNAKSSSYSDANDAVIANTGINHVGLSAPIDESIRRLKSDVVTQDIQCSQVPGFTSLSHAASLAAKNQSVTPLILTVDTSGSVVDGGGGGDQMPSGKDSKSRCNEDRLSTASLDCSGALNLRRYDRHSVSSISSDTRVDSTRPNELNSGNSDVAISHSIDKIWSRPMRRERPGYDTSGVVRSSWSQENYFDDADVTCIDIELDDEDLASSVDVLHYRDPAAAGDTSGHSWTEDDLDTDSCIYSGKLRSWAPLTGDVFDSLSSESESDISECGSPVLPNSFLFYDLKSKKPSTSCPVGVGIAVMSDSDDVIQGFPVTRLSYPDVKPAAVSDSNHTVDADPARKTILDDSLLLSSDADDSCINEPVCVEEVLGVMPTRPSVKDVDRPSAARLAKRLFYLHGFRRSDVSRHLMKRNSFSQLVGEEFLKFFDFSDESLDVALRRFVRHLTQNSEAQDRDQLLSHFVRRYIECNHGSFKSEDCCHTLACAIMLLNTELNLQSVGPKMTLVDFIDNLCGMNDGEDFERNILTSIYESIQSVPLQFEIDDSTEAMTQTTQQTNTTPQAVIAATQIKYNTTVAATGNQTTGIANPLLQAPDSSNVAEFKKGFIMRKCCIDPDGRKTALGRRGWKMFYATLRDMTLYMYSDEHSYKRATHCSNVIHLHHTLATKAGDYVKKNHVFRLQTADMAQYLIQTSDSRECQEWIDTINFVAASYSAPYQFNSVGVSGAQKRFQRPLLPASYTTLSLRDQISFQEKMMAQFERELLEHRKDPPEKGARSRIIQEYCKKETYFKFEIKRYKTYVRLLQYKLAAFSELEPSLAETVIGEVDEPSTSPQHDSSNTARFNFVPQRVESPSREHSTELTAEDAGYSSGLDTLHEL